MPITWIEVADTSIKIGLGALISGMTGYVLATTNHDQSLKKDLVGAKTRILEEACTEIEAYFSFVNKIYNAIGALVVQSADDVREQTDIEKQLVDSIQVGLAEALDSRNRARAKISLLGATSALDHISKFNDTLTELRNIIARDERILSNDQYDTLIERFLTHKRDFYAEANKYLEKAALGKGA